jgi:hypothetical protein
MTKSALITTTISILGVVAACGKLDIEDKTPQTQKPATKHHKSRTNNLEDEKPGTRDETSPGNATENGAGEASKKLLPAALAPFSQEPSGACDTEGKLAVRIGGVSSCAKGQWKRLEAESSEIERTVSKVTGRQDFCGVEEYKLGAGPVCGENYTIKASPSCGEKNRVVRPIIERAPTCGVEHYEVRKSPVCGSDMVTSWTSWGTWSCSRGESVETEWRLSGILATPEPRQLCRYKEDRTCEHPSFPPTEYKMCQTGVQVVSIEYNTCEHPSHGFASHKSCRDPSFGPESFKSCDFHKTPDEAERYSATVLKSLQESLTHQMYNGAFWNFATEGNTRGITCLLSAAIGKVSIEAVTGWKEAFESLAIGTAEGVSAAQCFETVAGLDAKLCAEGDQQPSCTTWRQYAAGRESLKAIKANLTLMKSDSDHYHFDATRSRMIEAALTTVTKTLRFEP